MAAGRRTGKQSDSVRVWFPPQPPPLLTSRQTVQQAEPKAARDKF